MAFDAKQARRAQGAVLIVALVLVAVLLVVVLSGALTPRGTGTGAAAQGSASANAASAPTAADEQAKTQTQSTSSDSSIQSMDDVNATYGAAEKQLEAQRDADPSNPSAQLNLANGYFDWGVAAMSYASGDDDEAHVRDLFTKAIAEYDTYLKANPGSKSVTVDRAICIFYTGDTTRAIKELESFTASDDSFGPAWANLGMFYEKAGRTADARDAYERAVKADPDDTYQVKTYAQQRLDALSENSDKE